MKIGVLGLGYVGIVNVACFSKRGYIVYCTDVKQQKVTSVKEGKSPIFEPEVEELLKEGLQKGTIMPTDDSEELIKQSDILIICVGTPSKSDGEVNLDYLKNLVIEICSFLQPDDKKYVVFRSTVPPGTTEFLIKNFFDDRFPNIEVFF